MIDRTYMTARPAPPSRAKLAFDQRGVPAAIDAAAFVEAVLARIAARSRRAPGAAIACAFITGFALTFGRRRRS